jgi:acetylornithine deacetylase
MLRTDLLNQIYQLLYKLISTPSFSGREDKSAEIILSFLENNDVKVDRKYNNILAFNCYYDENKPLILLNSHHDTVKPNSGWTMDPFQPVIRDGNLYGLGSNDAGASLVALIATFIHYYNREDLKYNLLIALTGEEESSGEKGIASISPEIKKIDFAIVGEPTAMQMAIAEKGLIVLECQAQGQSGHAARDVGENAILKALKDIDWVSSYRFPEVSKLLGPIKMSVTMIEGGIQHNVIPDRCNFTIDIRSTDAYTSEEIVDIIRENISAEITRCSLRLKSSSIDKNHILVKSAQKVNITTFASPTLSDQALINAPSVKIGPGLSERSHTADEYVQLLEIESGVNTYIKLLDQLL